MANTTTGILMALGSSLAYGSADFLGGLGSRRYSSFQVLALSETVGMVAMGLLALAAGESWPAWRSIFYCTLGNLLGVVGLSMLYAGLARGNAAVVSPVAGVVGAAVPVLLEMATAGLPAPAVLLGFILAVPGIWLVTAISHKDRVHGDSGLRLGILAGVVFGLFFIAMAQVKSDGVFGSLAIGRLAAVMVVLGVLKFRREAPIFPQHNPPAVATGVLDVLGNAAYMLANQNVRLDVSVVLTSLYPAVTVFLSSVVLKEKIRGVQWLGVALCITAIVLIAR